MYFDCILLIHRTGTLLYKYTPNKYTKGVRGIDKQESKIVDEFLKKVFFTNKQPSNPFYLDNKLLLNSSVNTHKSIIVLLASKELINLEELPLLQELVRDLKTHLLSKLAYVKPSYLEIVDYFTEDEYNSESLSSQIEAIIKSKRNKELLTNKIEHTKQNPKKKLMKESTDNKQTDKITEKEDIADNKSSSIFNIFNFINVHKIVDKESLEQLKNSIIDKLISKNFESTIAVKIADTVSERMEGLKTNRLLPGALRREFNKIMKECFYTIFNNIEFKRKRVNDMLLNRNKSSDIEGPLKVAVVGVNGVGKSTTIAKLVNYFKNNKLKPFLVACDTFRSGAIEQLYIHSQKLGVPLYKDDYGSEPYKVAKKGIEVGKSQGADIVLIDTAGRLQNSENLMLELTKLIVYNSVDIVLIVVEALAGSDALNQVKGFNNIIKKNIGRDERMKKYKKENIIDGIIMSKIDSVDDKVGMALSLTYESEIPIVYMGIGQTYNDLMDLDINYIVDRIFK